HFSSNAVYQIGREFESKRGLPVRLSSLVCDKTQGLPEESGLQLAKGGACFLDEWHYKAFLAAQGRDFVPLLSTHRLHDALNWCRLRRRSLQACPSSRGQ